jgi:predicted transcriptional regulator
MKQKDDTVVADPELLRRAEALAARIQMSREEIINDALRGYLDWQEEFLSRIQQGMEAADRGDFATEEEVERVLNKYRPK